MQMYFRKYMYTHAFRQRGICVQEFKSNDSVYLYLPIYIYLYLPIWGCERKNFCKRLQSFARVKKQVIREKPHGNEKKKQCIRRYQLKKGGLIGREHMARKANANKTASFPFFFCLPFSSFYAISNVIDELYVNV